MQKYMVDPPGKGTERFHIPATGRPCLLPERAESRRGTATTRTCLILPRRNRTRIVVEVIGPSRVGGRRHWSAGLPSTYRCKTYCPEARLSGMTRS